MKKKLLIFTGSIGLSAMLFGRGMVALADAEHLSDLKSYNYVVPSGAVLNSSGKLDFSSGGNSILLDSADIHYLQEELINLYAEIDAYSSDNLAGK